MKPNKSIDGLTTRAAKKTVQKKPLAIKIEEAKEEKILIPDENLDIDVVLDDEAPKQKPKSEELSRAEAIEDFLSPVSALNLEDEPKKKKSNKLKKSLKITDEDTVITKRQKKPKKDKKKPSKLRRTITIIILVIVLALSGLIIWAVLWGNDIIAKITGGQGNILDLLTFMDEKYDPLKTDADGRTNILAFGTSGYNMEGDEGNGKHAGAQLTDSIMAISINQKTGDVAMLSLPRDLKASPTCTATGKINEVYWCNNQKGDNEAAGADALMTKVGDILGIEFQYYAHLNWGSLVSIVDTLGGIKVTLDEDINDKYWTGAVYKAGIEYTLNGEEALGLARARHGTSGGDFTRGNSQQKILIGIKDRIFEKNLSITDIVSLASTLGDNLRTNFSVSELKTAAHLTFTFDFETIRQISLWPDFMTTANINGISYVVPKTGAGNYSKIRTYVAKQLSNDPRDYEGATILVLNATETYGLAAEEQKKLEEAGYSNISVDNAPEGEYNEGYTIYKTTNDKPGTLSLLEDFYGITSENTLPEGISNQYDFIVIINS